MTGVDVAALLRLIERYMDPPGVALPDALIAARLANALEASFRQAGTEDYAGRFAGKFDWKTEEGAFLDGYHRHAEGGEFVTYDRLRAAGTNGVFEPVTGYENEMHPDDMTRLGLQAGDLVEIYNDVGSTQAMAYPTPAAKSGQAFMLFIAPTGQVGNIISKGTNELMIPNYKNVWANIRRIGHAPAADDMSFKNTEYPHDL